MIQAMMRSWKLSSFGVAPSSALLVQKFLMARQFDVKATTALYHNYLVISSFLFVNSRIDYLNICIYIHTHTHKHTHTH